MHARRILAVTTLALLATACLDEVEVTPADQRTPAIQVSPAGLTFSVGLGAPSPAARTVIVSNGGGGVLTRPVVTVAYTSGTPGWLAESLTGDRAPFTLTLTPTSTGLPAGTHIARVSLDSASTSRRPTELVITLLVLTPARLDLSASALQFTSSVDGGAPAAQTVTVSNGGQVLLPQPTATILYRDGEPTGWLTATVTGSAAPYTVTFQPTTGTLPGGTYLAVVELRSAGASNSPVAVQVSFTVLRPRLDLSATSLLFTAPADGVDPAAQTVTVSNGGQGSLVSPTATIVYRDGEPTGWLAATVTGSAAPYTVTFQPTTGTLPAGTYVAVVELRADGAANSPASVQVSLAVPRLVTVARQVTYWGDEGTTPVEVADPDVQSIELLQDDGAGGTRRVTAAPGPAGSWSAQLPAGPYWILATRTTGGFLYVQTSADTVDLGTDVAGRADVVRADLPTDATLDLLALEPWDSLNDSLSLVSYGAQAGVLLDAFTTPAVPLFDGEVDLFGFAFDWSTAVGPLLVPEDQLWITQLRYRQTTNLEYRETTTFSSLTGLSMSSGTPVALTAPDAQFITGTSLLLLDWRRSQFEGALPPSISDNPTAHAVTVSAVPARLEAPSPLVTGGVPLLLAVRGLTSEFDPDFSAGVLDYGTFLPAGWSVAFSASLALEVTRTAPGATTAAPGLRDHVFRNDAIAAAPNPVVPLVGGPLTPTLDGADALVERTGLTTTPTLAWAAPAVGTATSYLVDLQQLVANGAATELRPVALFALDGTSLTIPAGLLERGGTYVAKLVARSNPSDAGGASPFRVGVPYGEAAYWTERFTTAP